MDFILNSTCFPYYRVSKGVRELPGSFNSATSSVPSGKSLVYFGFFLAAGFFFIFIAFTIFLPVMVLKPQKFAICFTIGCAFIVGSFFALKGPRNQLSHMLSKEVFQWYTLMIFHSVFWYFHSLMCCFPQRLPFTLGFLGSMVGTIYVSMVLHSYILSVLFSVLQVLLPELFFTVFHSTVSFITYCFGLNEYYPFCQVLALLYYAVSYFPGGSAGMKFLSSTLTSSVLRCFGRWHTSSCVAAARVGTESFLLRFWGL